jgi:creatinine amidohydrolase
VKLADLTYAEVAELVGRGPVVAIVPVGSTEPHGPHLPLSTDTRISEEASARAVLRLAHDRVVALVAPSVPYGVTDYAGGFAGAIGLRPEVLVAFLEDLAGRFLREGFAHVCFVNNHLEPAHDAAVREAASKHPNGSVSVACPLTRRWGRTLSDEFKRGDCHAGRYETSLVLAAGDDVRASYKDLPTLGVSLADGIREGKKTFVELGMSDAYTGAPSLATAEEGEELYDKLAEMVATEVREALAAKGA